jgi:hypothetical protein
MAAASDAAFGPPLSPVLAEPRGARPARGHGTIAKGRTG